MRNLKVFYFLLSILLFQNGHSGFYGEDSRKWISNNTPKDIKKLAMGVGARVSQKNLLKVNNSVFSIVRYNRSNKTPIFCDDKFKSSESLSSCTGFLVAPDIVLTAGHCMLMDEDCKDNVWIFNWEKNRKVFSNNDIYSCKEVLFSTMGEYFHSRDFALIKLDRQIKGGTILKLNIFKNTQRTEEVFVIGHPLGFPKTFVENATVTGLTPELVKKDLMSLTKQSDYFYVDTDTFEGNSGSPVFNKKNFLVEGIIIEGNLDLKLNPQKKCYEVLEIKVSKWGKKEKVLRSTAIKRILDFNKLNFFDLR